MDKKEIESASSEKLFWVLQIIFGFVLARSFYTYSHVLIPPFTKDILTLSLAVLAVYSTVLTSWIDFSYTIVRRPYKPKVLSERIRFFIDLFIVLAYTYLLVYLDYISENPDKSISQFFLCFSVIYLGYLISGLFRRKQYGVRASKIDLITWFLLLFIILSLAYTFFFNKWTSNNVLYNRVFITLAILLTIIYRLVRGLRRTRNKTIAVDMDGVLANQISGIIPKIKEEFELDIEYADIKNWKEQIGNSSIDKIIMSHQKEKHYILDMPVHKNAKKVLDKIIKKHYVVIATARPADTDNWTKEWLENNHIHYDYYHNLKEGGKQNADETFDVLIDDYPGNISQFLKNHKEGKAILFSQPWNKNSPELDKFIENKTLKIAQNWNEVSKFLEEFFNEN